MKILDNFGNEVNELEGIPPILYKYRTWEEVNKPVQYQRKILTENQIFLSSASGFNDPFDSTLPFKYRSEEMTRENVYMKLRQLAKGMWPTETEQFIEEKCYVRQFSGVFESGDYWKDFYPTFRQDVAEKFGILSLASRPDNLLMWSHYSNSHQGFCVGFDSKMLFELIGGQIAPVLYSEKFPELDLFSSFVENVYKLLSTKSVHWFYEEEFRIRKSNSANLPLEFPSECIKQIFIGCNMPMHIKLEIYDICEKKFSHAEIFETAMNNENFELNLNRIHMLKK